MKAASADELFREGYRLKKKHNNSYSNSDLKLEFYLTNLLAIKMDFGFAASAAFANTIVTVTQCNSQVGIA